jgi:hypothetical protein
MTAGDDTRLTIGHGLVSDACPWQHQHRQLRERQHPVGRRARPRRKPGPARSAKPERDERTALLCRGPRNRLLRRALQRQHHHRDAFELARDEFQLLTCALDLPPLMLIEHLAPVANVRQIRDHMQQREVGTPATGDFRGIADRQHGAFGKVDGDEDLLQRQRMIRVG